MSAAHNSKANRSAWLCFVLAGMTMAVTGWFIVEGVNSTEPDSPAKMAKIAAGVLLLILEVAVFGLAGKWPEHKTVLRALGWSVLVLEIALMSIAQISIGMTASKSSTGGVASITGLENKEAGARENAKRLQARADELRATGLTASIKKAALEEQKAVKQTAIADAAGDDARKMRGGSVGTPIAEIIGQTGLFILSCSMSLLLSLAGICLMHVAGCLWRNASGELPIDQQILELLHKIHGAPVAPVAELAAPVAPVLDSFKPAETAAPKVSYSNKIKLAGAGLLAATVAPTVMAAPAVSTQAKAPSVPAVAPANSASETVHPGASETLHSAHDTTSFDAAPTVPTAGQPGASETIQAGASKTLHSAAKKPRAKRAASSKLDTGVDGVAGARYLRVKAGVKAGKIRPSLRGIQAIEGGSQGVVADYLTQLAADGVIVKSGRGWTLAKKGGKA